MPMRAVLAGIDSDGGNVYVGRSKRDNALLPGKVVSTHRVCYVACGDQEQTEDNFQVSLHFNIVLNIPFDFFTTQNCNDKLLLTYTYTYLFTYLIYLV